MEVFILLVCLPFNITISNGIHIICRFRRSALRTHFEVLLNMYGFWVVDISWFCDPLPATRKKTSRNASASFTISVKFTFRAWITNASRFYSLLRLACRVRVCVYVCVRCYLRSDEIIWHSLCVLETPLKSWILHIESCWEMLLDWI